MRLKNYLYRLTGAISAFALLACVDDSFNLDDVSTEVTLGSGTTTLPLGYLENKTLEELLGGDIEGLLKDEEGNLSYNYLANFTIRENERTAILSCRSAVYGTF